MAQPGPPPGAPVQLQPGQQPTPDQIRAMRAQIAAEAQRAGLTVPQYIERVKQQAAQQQMQQQAQAQAQAQGPQGAPPGQQVPIAPGPPKPEALAVASFLRSQDLKLRTCIFQEKRKDMFRVKRAIRALQSPAYAKARTKNALLPEVKNRATAEDTFKLLPMSLLALRVSKVDPQANAKKKRVKGLWTVKVEPQQDARDDYHYVWLYEGSQWKNKLYAAGALTLILAVVFFPVWPYHLRLGVWYLSMGMLGLLGLFFGMAIFRLILFLVTMFATPPGFWLFPNLFEDVGFFDSFKPLWAWHEDEKAVKKRKKAEKEKKRARREAKAAGKTGKTSTTANTAAHPAEVQPKTTQPTPAGNAKRVGSGKTTATGSTPANGVAGVQQRHLNARVEEAEDE